jgi:hypothetical protein
MNQTDNNTADDFRFEVALSFAGDNKRDKIREIAIRLRAKLGDGKVFFDEFFKSDLAGLDADIYFQKVYGQDTRLVVACVCECYNEKIWTQFEWRAIRSFILGHRDNPVGRSRFLPIRFDDGNVDGLYPDIDVILDVREWDVDSIVDLILRRHKHCRGEKSFKQKEKGEITSQAISALIGVIRQHDLERLLPLARIAHAHLRNSLMPDTQPSNSDSHPIAIIVHSLINDPISTAGDTHPAIRFCVLLCELCSIIPELQKALRNWFQTYCVPAGYLYDAVLGELPYFPEDSKRYIWLDVHWSNPMPGESAITATAYLRCGKLQYRVADNRSQLDEEMQFAQVVRSYYEKQQKDCPVNHVAAVTQRSKMLEGWDSDPQTKDPLPLPVAVREENDNRRRICPSQLDANTNANWATEENLSLRTQCLGFFITGRIAAIAVSFPCDVFNKLLNSATVGIWTRGPSESDADDASLRDNSHVADLRDLPRLIHDRRTGAINAQSVWRRVVLYFNPNIPPLDSGLNTSLEIQQVNSQLI